ncbi:mitochondrial genome maintenance protein [Mucor mucedo]|uniref:mitochondrial genome maintenance protein n=1 Tax=Mucor mucedo TaxID=29922 RepID=UPI0022207FAF|nr:mitochondrial genome maintenance protein [Mucor mucedo]KAI7889796.1 mitochondrial genome maintenance protein [Mucor mucedo]
MQAFGGLKRIATVPQWTRAVSTTRFVKIAKKETVTPYSNNISKVKVTKEAEKPVLRDVEPVVREAIAEKPVMKEIVSAAQQHFPTTKEFDTPSEEPQEVGHNWSSSFFGLSTEKFPREVADILLEPINADDIEIKPDGLIYLPEIKYRRILNRAFGPGGWGLAPRGEHTISPKNISREYALICSGRFVSQARGEQDFFDISGLPTASEGCKSNALMRCCKDLGIASELWDPVFIRKFKKKYGVEVWAEHVTTKKKKRLWRKKDDVLEYPYKEN